MPWWKGALWLVKTHHGYDVGKGEWEVEVELEPTNEAGQRVCVGGLDILEDKQWRELPDVDPAYISLRISKSYPVLLFWFPISLVPTSQNSRQPLTVRTLFRSRKNQHISGSLSHMGLSLIILYFVTPLSHGQVFWIGVSPPDRSHTNHTTIALHDDEKAHYRQPSIVTTNEAKRKPLHIFVDICVF